MATRKIITDLNLNGNELQNAVMQNLALAPQNPKKGQHYFDTVSNTEFVWNGTAWVDALNQGSTYTFSDGLTKDASNNVTLDKAKASSIGGVKIGSNIDVDANGTISVKDATNAQKGLIQIATDTDAETGTDEAKAINSKQLANAIADKIELTDLSADAPITYDNATGKISATFDNAPTANSQNLLKSGAIKTALDDKVTKNSAITGAKKCKITYDEKGLVTAGEDLVASDIPDLSETYIAVTQKGVNNGVASLGADGKVPASQLPSYVDDVKDAYIVSGATALSAGWLSETDGGSALTPEKDKIYVILSSGKYANKTYRWSGSAYVAIANPDVATETDAGIARLATQAEVTTGTDDATIVTPKKLKAVTDAINTEVEKKIEKFAIDNPALTVSGGVATWTIANSIGSADVVCSIREKASGEEVYAQIVYGDSTITASFNADANVSAGEYRAVVVG